MPHQDRLIEGKKITIRRSILRKPVTPTNHMQREKRLCNRSQEERRTLTDVESGAERVVLVRREVVVGDDSKDRRGCQ